MQLRRFLPDGTAAFTAFLDSLSTDSALPWPETALVSDNFSAAVGCDVSIDHRQFGTRFELAKYLHSTFEEATWAPDLSDVALWAWLACFYFKEVCPLDSYGRLKPGAITRWIPQSSDWRRYYRHLIVGPFSIYRTHRDNPERALAVLCQRPGRPGDLVEQLASRQQIVTNPQIMQIATDCFVDPQTRSQRRSANSKGPLGPRRLITVLDQLDVTWDLASTSLEALRARLPAQFR